MTEFGKRATPLGNKNSSRHLYDLEVSYKPDGKVVREVIEVFANTRGQANAIATEAGYVTFSVNMVG